MITIITGTPGAGKTLYTVQNFISKLVGKTIKGPDGEEIPRTIYTNINGLMLDHELIDGSSSGGLNNWHEWAKPGSVIVFDEVQKVWPPRPNGAAIPEYIKALETHRHMGVDFILITQGIMLIDRNLTALCGQHYHIRRLGNSRSCIVYEWDHASRTLMYSKAFAKKIWRYDKKIFKLYKSAELHTKQKRSLPFVLWFLLAAVILMIYMLPKVAGIFSSDAGLPSGDVVSPSPVGGGAVAVPDATVDAPVAAAPLTADEWAERYKPRFYGLPYSAPAYDHLTQPQVVPKPAACILMRNECKCYTQRGTEYGTTDYLCRYYVKHGVFLDFEPDEGARAASVLSPVADDDGR